MEDQFRSKNSRWFHNKFFIVFCGIFSFLLFCFLLSILIMVSINFKRENDLQSQINEKTQGDSIMNTIKNSLYDYIGKDSIHSQSYTFSKKYKLNTEHIDKIQSIDEYIKSKFIEINDPHYFFQNKENNNFITKNYLLKGDVQIKKTDKLTISYSITSNLPLFSAIKYVQISLNSNSIFMINKVYSLCTNEHNSDQRCDRYIGKLFNDYYGIFYGSDEDDNDIIQESKNKSINTLLKGHYTKTITNEDKEENIDNITDTTPIITDDIIFLVFFIDENTLSVINKTASISTPRSKQLKHKNTLGEIAFVIEPFKI